MKAVSSKLESKSKQLPLQPAPKTIKELPPDYEEDIKEFDSVPPKGQGEEE
jgi:hypothetical protein